MTTLLGIIILFPTCLFGQTTRHPDPVEEAHQLAGSERFSEAFDKYVTIPGCESLALRLTRKDPRAFLDRLLMADYVPKLPAARRSLLVAELQLMLGDEVTALVGFRKVTEQIAETDEQGWEQGLLPRNAYFVEVPEQATKFGQRQPGVPFASGTGSHRDNVLIRRFITLKAGEDARREFDRIWQLHRECLQPYWTENYALNGRHRRCQPLRNWETSNWSSFFATVFRKI